jgi:threonine dehydratase
MDGVVTRPAIEEAAHRIAPYVRRTPVLTLEPGAFGLRVELLLKLEFLQHAGSFKPRGALNRILSADVPTSGVIAASGGNHGLAVAHAARQLGHPAEIFVPRLVSPVKLERLRGYGAAVHVEGATYADALRASRERAAATGALEVHAYDDPEVVAGQGTLGRELEDQAPGLDTVLVAVGGGGLVAGIAAWLGGQVRIVGVEPRRAPSLHAALAAGRPTDVEVGGVAADSLGASRVGGIAFGLARRYVETVVLVEDEDIRAAQRALWSDLRIVAEPGGATALAGLLGGGHPLPDGERVGVIVCGGNADLAALE